MSLVSGPGNIVPRIKERVEDRDDSLGSGAIGKLGLQLLKELVSSAFERDGNGGLFSEKVSLSLPNPLARLNHLIEGIQEKLRLVKSIFNIFSKLSDLVTGKRKLENDEEVTVPALSERAPKVAERSESLIDELLGDDPEECIEELEEARQEQVRRDEEEAERNCECDRAADLRRQDEKVGEKREGLKKVVKMMRTLSQVFALMGDVSRQVKPKSA